MGAALFEHNDTAYAAASVLRATGKAAAIHPTGTGKSFTSIRHLENQRDMADKLFDCNVASEMTLPLGAELSYITHHELNADFGWLVYLCRRRCIDET